MTSPPLKPAARRARTSDPIGEIDAQSYTAFVEELTQKKADG